MRRHTPDAFDTAVQKSNIWLRDIEAAGPLRDRFQAYAALRAVLHALRDCLPPNESAKLSAQLPLLLKGVFYDGWKYSAKPMRLTREGFQAHMRRSLRDQEGLDPSIASRAVLAALYEHVSPQLVDAVRAVLPRDVRAYLVEQRRPLERRRPAPPGRRPVASRRSPPRGSAPPEEQRFETSGYGE